MGFLRSRLARNIGLVVGLGAGMLGFASRDASADVIAPSAAHLGGMHGSFWLTDMGVYNPFSFPVTVDVYATPRNHSEDPAAAPLMTRVVAPHNTMLIGDVESALHGSDYTGVDRLRLTFKDNANATVPNLKVTVAIYNLAGPGQEFGMQETVFDPATDYHATGTTLIAQLSKDGMRDGVLVMTGPDGATIEWTYRNGAGANETTVTGSYGPNQTFQYTSNVPQLIGFTPEPSGSLEAKITAGTARTALTHNNNTTNDPAWDDMTVKPEIMSLDAQAIGYVARWLPRSDAGFYLSNREIRAMINGGSGTRSYTPELAALLWNDPNVQANFTDVQAVEQWFRDRADGVPTNSEFCATFDPFLWDNDAQGEPGIAVYDGISCGPVSFRPGATAMQGVYSLVKEEFLWRFVRNNPDEFGGQIGGPPDINFNPTWSTQDGN